MCILECPIGKPFHPGTKLKTKAELHSVFFNPVFLTDIDTRILHKPKMQTIFDIIAELRVPTR